jgi:hypothetical protein
LCRGAGSGREQGQDERESRNGRRVLHGPRGWRFTEGPTNLCSGPYSVKAFNPFEKR